MGKQAAKQVAKRGRGRPPKAKPPAKPKSITKAAPHIEELLSRDSLGKGNIKLLERAVEWPISPELREKILRRMGKLVESKNEKIAVAASRVVVAADNVNVRREGNAIHAEKLGTSVNVNITLEASKQQAELAALAAEIRSGRVVEGLFTTREAIDCGANGEAIDPSTQGSDGDH